MYHNQSWVYVKLTFFFKGFTLVNLKNWKTVHANNQFFFVPVIKSIFQVILSCDFFLNYGWDFKNKNTIS